MGKKGKGRECCLPPADLVARLKGVYVNSRHSPQRTPFKRRHEKLPIDCLIDLLLKEGKDGRKGKGRQRDGMIFIARFPFR